MLDQLYNDPGLGPIAAWNDVAYDATTGIATYGTYYRAGDGRLWEALSRIRFTPLEAVAARIAEAGLRVHDWLGGWTAKGFTSGAKEIIPVGGLA